MITEEPVVTTAPRRRVCESLRRGESPRILFVRPTQPTDEGFVAPLGILHLASAIRERYPETEFRVVDYGFDGLTPKSFTEIVREFRPNIVGYSGLTHEFGVLSFLVACSRRAAPDAMHLVGGPLGTYNYEEVFAECDVDYVVRGEGEVSMLALMDAWYADGPTETINGIVFEDDQQGLRKNPDMPFIEDLDSMPLPAWDLVDLKRYSKVRNWNGVQKEKIYAPVFTSRGCPFSCTYCHTIFGKRFRERSPESIVAELKILHDRHGVRELHIVDDIFNLKKDRTKEIAQAILDSGMKFAIAFPNGVRVDVMNEEVLDMLAKAGTYKVNYAIETVTPRLQKEMKKHLKLDKAQEMITITSKKGIITFGFFMIGFPSETREEMQSTIDFAVESDLDTAKFFKVTPFKGTELGDQARADDEEITKRPLREFSFYDPSTTVCKAVPADELEELLKSAYRRFYADPQRLWRIFRKFPERLRALRSLWAIRRWTRGHGRADLAPEVPGEAG